MLTLQKALAENRLAEFIAQEERRGVGPADGQAFEDLTEALIKSKRQEDQTSHSASRDGSRGK